MFTKSLTTTLIVLFVLAVAVASTSFVARSRTGDVANISEYEQIEAVRLQRSLVWDHSYHSIEQIRTARSSAALTSSYDRVESIRVMRTLAPADSSYKQVELVRIARGLVADRSYDSIEAIRLLY